MAGETNYYGRSWRLLTRDKGWIKVLLVMAIATVVPIAGPLGVLGYALEWARLTAWGVDAAPKQKGVGVGACIKSGWRGFVVMLGWNLALMLVFALLRSLFHYSSVLEILILVVTVFSEVLFFVAALRAAIYQDFKAGYQANRLYDMLKRDFGGVAHVTGVTCLMSLVVGIIMAVLFSVLLMPLIMQLATFVATSSSGYYGSYYYGYPSTDAMALRMMADTVGSMVPGIVVAIYLGNVLASFYSLITVTMVALWMRQFNVPAWGASGDPLPEVGSVGLPATPPSPASQQASPTEVPAQPAPPASAEAATSAQPTAEVPTESAAAPATTVVQEAEAAPQPAVEQTQDPAEAAEVTPASEPGPEPASAPSAETADGTAE